MSRPSTEKPYRAGKTSGMKRTITRNRQEFLIQCVSLTPILIIDVEYNTDIVCFESKVPAKVTVPSAICSEGI